MLTTVQIAEMLGINDRTVRRWIESGKLYAVRDCGYLQYLIADHDLIKCVGRLDVHTKAKLEEHLKERGE